MALQVWLPLNGSMENQGLLNLTPTQQGTISWIDGKIGKCLSAGNANQTVNGISYNSNLVAELGTEFSAAVWVKPLGNHVHYNGTFVSSGNWNAKRWAFGVNQTNSQVDVFCQGHNTYIACQVPVNIWTHLCCVHQGTTVKLYKNGEYVGEKTDVAEGLNSDAANFCVGRETYASGYFSFNGNLNDLRIYNHALSVKEIKELFKGLVLHYKLNDLAEEYGSTVFDSSGYNYNAVSMTENLELSTNTVKYSYSTHFGANDYIKLESPNSEIKTISLWAKWDSIPSGQSIIFVDYKSKLGLGLMSTGILCGTSGPGNYYTYNKSGIVANTWYHFVVVNPGDVTGTSRKLYINGIEQTPTTSVSNWTYAVSEMQIGKRSTSSDGFAGLISDFRAYATVLSADDVLELYHTAASIDNQGNLFCGEVVE